MTPEDAAEAILSWLEHHGYMDADWWAEGPSLGEDDPKKVVAGIIRGVKG